MLEHILSKTKQVVSKDNVRKVIRYLSSKEGIATLKLTVALLTLFHAAETYREEHNEE